MSYDLFVFDAARAPRDRNAFLSWFSSQVGSDGIDVKQPPPALARWYDEMASVFPDMNGPGFSDDNVDNPKVTGYSFTPNAIYLDFRWNVAEEAYQAVRRLAVKHNVGFYDVSGDEGNGEIYFPGDTLREPSAGAWRKVAADFREFTN